MEVDFILGDAEIAIEVKISSAVHQSELKGLITFSDAHKPRKALVVSLDKKPRRIFVNQQEILILPWKIFLQQLWVGEII